MTLKEKFQTDLSINTLGEAGRYATECEQIADEYAVEFAEWLLSRSIGETIQLKDDTLEKFKKEKGL